ncbi:MAG: hypothetical protein JXR37_04830 [Kiritimatiellae bacterium]|nr:hypothetical protein [Kiritimatiellia bacterium]
MSTGGTRWMMALGMLACACATCPARAGQPGAPQVEAEVEFVQVAMEDVSAMLAGGGVNVEALRELCKKGKARLLAAPRLITGSGRNATVKGVTEIMYPTQFKPEAPEVKQAGTNLSLSVSRPIAVVPAEFERREIGAIVNVCPTVQSDMNTIDVIIQSEFGQIQNWTEYGFGYPVDQAMGPQIAPMKLPVVENCSLTEQVAMDNGATVVLGGASLPTGGDKAVYMLLSVRIVDTQGKPVRERP